MVKTKITPRKAIEVRHVMSCLLCQEEFVTEEQLKTHLLQCVKNKASIKCTECSKTFKRREYLRRHMKNIHAQSTSRDAGSSVKVVQSTEIEESDEDANKSDDLNSDNEGAVESDAEQDVESTGAKDEKDDLAQYDPGSLIGDISSDHESQNESDNDAVEGNTEDRSKRVVEIVNEVEVGRTVRKKTTPLPVMAPLKRKENEIMAESVESSESAAIETKTDDSRDSATRKRRPDNRLCDKGTQTSVARERKRVKITTNYMENGRQVEMVEEHETEWLI